MLITGQIIATADLFVIDEAARSGFKLLYVGDVLETPKQWNFINAIGFVPDYQCMSAIIEGDDNRFALSYIQNLKNPMAEELFAIILAALCKGTGIMLYFPEDTLQLKYPYLLMQYMQDNYGLIVGDKSNPFSYNQVFDSSNTRLMYLYKLVDWKTYILNVDEADPMILMRLREDLCPLYSIPINISDVDMINEVTRIKSELINPPIIKPKKQLFSKAV